jgi:hypothetical protein
MKALLTLIFSCTLILSQGQTNSTNPLFEALGKTLSKKEFKELAGMKCVVASRIQVVSKKNDISFSLNVESQALINVDLRQGFFEREPYQLNPILGIIPGLVYRDTYELVKKSDGITKLSKYNEQSRYFSFYYQPNEKINSLFFNVYFKMDESDQLILDRISFSHTKE